MTLVSTGCGAVTFLAPSAFNAAKAAVGIAASALSLLTFGKISAINEKAELTFKAQEILPLVHRFLLGIVNPKSIFAPETIQMGIITQTPPLIIHKGLIACSQHKINT